MRQKLFYIPMLLVVVSLAARTISMAFAADGKAPVSSRDEQTKQKNSSKPPVKQLYTGKVVLLQEALKRKGVTAYNEFKNQVVLETPTGELIPIVPDWRGRAFYQDKRLRNRKVDLVGYRKKGVPYLQILMVFTYNKKGERQYTDYWCDICSIPMYEIKPCDCCQDPIRLRFQTRELPSYLSHKNHSSDTKQKKTKKPKRSSPSPKNGKP